MEYKQMINIIKTCVKIYSDVCGIIKVPEETKYLN